MLSGLHLPILDFDELLCTKLVPGIFYSSKSYILHFMLSGLHLPILDFGELLCTKLVPGIFSHPKVTFCNPHN